VAETSTEKSVRRKSNRARVLFVCVGNACRSPMAEAIACYDAADVIEPSSAGLSPMGAIAEQTKQTLAANGYSAGGLTSDLLTREKADGADIIINKSGKPREQHFWQADKVEDWIVQDPYGSEPETYQRVFEGIKRRVHQLALSLRETRASRSNEK